jgi:catechol O-methyltransferase
MNVKRRLPFLRLSLWRFGMGLRSFVRTGQIGYGREEACAAYVEAKARRGDIDHVIDTIDEFCAEKINAAQRRRREGRAARCRCPSHRSETGAGARHLLRVQRAAHRQSGPQATVFSVEFADANAAIARRIWAHAGVGDRITCVVGSIGDGGRTLDALADEHGLGAGKVDLLFLDHDKNAYLADLQNIVDRSWLHRNAIVVADNVRVPGAPKYRAYMRDQQGKLWDTVEHKTHVEYQSLIPDLVLESTYLGG